MATKRKQHGAAIKAKVAIEALRERKTTSEIAGKYSIHPTQVTKWKQEAISRLPELFTERRSRGEWVDTKLVPSLYEQVGKLQVELEWLKKKPGHDSY